MRRLILLLAILVTPVRAETTAQCVDQHFKLAKQYPDIAYEKDQQIVRIWCECRVKKTNSGTAIERAVEQCTRETNEPINRYLQSQ